MYCVKKMTEDLGGAKIYLKREDLNHTGAHKINNVLGQVLLAKKMGKTRVIAETGAGQHGVATATAAALMGLECEIFMGKEDTDRQALNVFRMELLGAKVHAVTSGTMTLKHVRSRESLGDYIARFTHEMEDGTRLNIHKLRYGASTIKNYKGFIIQFDEFCKAKRKRFDFGDIDLKFYDDFVAWFTAKDYSINTIGRHVKELKIIMRAAREEGLHDNGLIESRKFRVLTADVENIYLTESEIRAIANLDLSDNKHKDIARDVFLVGCYTAQRFSDYSTINEGNIRTLESGQLVIDLKQQKTGNHVIIPVRPELQAILDKYENRLPKSYEQKVNKFIKEITREAGITEKIEVSYVENGERKTHLVEKCDLVKTHT